MSHRRFHFLLLALPLLSACQRGAQPISEADKAALRAHEDKFAELVLAKNWPALAAMYAPNATFMPPNQPMVSGRAGVQSWMAGFPPASAFKLIVQEIEGVGDLAYVRSNYELTMAIPGAPSPVTDHGKALAILQRTADGGWEYTNDIFNSDLPPAPPAPAAAKSK